MTKRVTLLAASLVLLVGCIGLLIGAQLGRTWLTFDRLGIGPGTVVGAVTEAATEAATQAAAPSPTAQPTPRPTGTDEPTPTAEPTDTLAPTEAPSPTPRPTPTAEPQPSPTEPELAAGLPRFTLLTSVNGDLEPPTESRQQSSSMVFDVDGDGLNDFVIGSRTGRGPYVTWHRRTASGWERYLIEDENVSMSPSGAVMDVDRDGDLDVILGSGSSSDREGGEIWWWENPAPDYDPETPWQRYSIKTQGAPKHHDMAAADFDNDGTPELVYWNQYARALMLSKLPSDPKSLEDWPAQPIFTWEGSSILLEGLEAADMDDDGLLDLVGAGRWFKNNGGLAFTPEVIDLEFEYGRVAAGDIRPGGRLEVVMSVGDDTGRIQWYQWDGKTWVGHDLGPGEFAHSLQLVDINNDGNLDIFAAEQRLDGDNPDSGMWFFLGDGLGRFEQVLVAEGYDNHENRVADLDGDGDLDILGKPFNYETPRLDIWINEGPELQAESALPSGEPGAQPGGEPAAAPAEGGWQRHVIEERRPWRALFVDAADIDGDGLEDVVTAAWWYRNPGSPAGEWERNEIADGFHNLAVIHDFDADGDPDLLGTQGDGASLSSVLVWAENNGAGRFRLHENLYTGRGDFLQGAVVGRFTGSLLGEERLGVALSWHEHDSPVELLSVPDDPVSGRWQMESLFPVGQSEGLSAGDIDRDGLTDLLLGTVWLRSGSPQPGSWQPFTLSGDPGEPDRNLLVDMNQDGRLDALVGFESDSKPALLVWYEQGEDPRQPWTEHVIANPPIIAPMSVDAADLDGDGDLDVVAGEHNLRSPDQAGLFVFLNADGQGQQWTRQTVWTGDEHHAGAQLVDIDGDGDLDILSIGWNHRRVLIYENLSR